MITDEELKRWAERYNQEFTPDCAMPRLIAEVERLRECEADCDTYESIFRHVLKNCQDDPALGAAAKVAAYFAKTVNEYEALKLRYARQTTDLITEERQKCLAREENVALKAEVERLRVLVDDARGIIETSGTVDVGTGDYWRRAEKWIDSAGEDEPPDCCPETREAWRQRAASRLGGDK